MKNSVAVFAVFAILSPYFGAESRGSAFAQKIVQQAAKQKQAKDQQTADLPRVLIIGDSISLGYTPHVKQLLSSTAVVEHNKGNAQHTGTGLKKLDQWLGKTKWDVIHFNWGLWDLCYRHPKSKVQGKRDKVNGTITMPLEQYKKNLEKLVVRLKATDAKLIWANTTVVPEAEAGRKLGDDKRYNDAAKEIMKKHGVAIDDLHTVTKTFSSELFTKPGDVHYTTKGYQKIAGKVGKAITTAIAAK